MFYFMLPPPLPCAPDGDLSEVSSREGYVRADTPSLPCVSCVVQPLHQPTTLHSSSQGGNVPAGVGVGGGSSRPGATGGGNQHARAAFEVDVHASVRKSFFFQCDVSSFVRIS